MKIPRIKPGYLFLFITHDMTKPHMESIVATEILYPSLSEESWVNTPDKIADYLFSTFFVAEYSQTYLYKGMVSSFPWIIQNAQGDILRTITDVRQNLTSYFSTYFDNVIIEVNDVTNPEEPSKVGLSIYAKFTDKQGVDHVLGKLLRVSNSIIESIINLNNG